MTEEIIQDLPELLRTHICTLKKASLDDSNNINMCQSSIKVIHFDKIPSEYSRGKTWKYMPKSNDALYIGSDGFWYFIEFKNGGVDKSDVYRKLYDSLIMLVELEIIPDFDFARKFIKYILVYNSEKYPNIQKSDSRDAAFSYLLRLAQSEVKLFDLKNFEGYLINEVHTYSKELFHERFIVRMERQENRTAV